MALREGAARYAALCSEMRTYDAHVANDHGGDLGKLTTVELVAQKARVAECAVLCAGFPALMLNARRAFVHDMFARHGAACDGEEDTAAALMRMLRAGAPAVEFAAGETTTCTGCGDVVTERVRAAPQPLPQCADRSNNTCACEAVATSTCASCWAKSVSEQLDTSAAALVRDVVTTTAEDEAAAALSCSITCAKCGTQDTCLFRTTAVPPPVPAPPAVAVAVVAAPPPPRPRPRPRSGLLHAGTSVSVPPPPAWTATPPAIASSAPMLAPAFGTQAAAAADEDLVLVPFTFDELGSGDVYGYQSPGAFAHLDVDADAKGVGKGIIDDDDDDDDAGGEADADTTPADRIRRLDVDTTEHIRFLSGKALVTLGKLRGLIDRRTKQNDSQVETCGPGVAHLADRLFAIKIAGTSSAPAVASTTTTPRPRKRGRCSSCHAFGHVITNCHRLQRAPAMKSKRA